MHPEMDGHAASRPGRCTAHGGQAASVALAVVRNYFTREKAVVLQNTAATQPDSSTEVLLLTVRVPE